MSAFALIVILILGSSQSMLRSAGDAKTSGAGIGGPTTTKTVL